MGTGAPGGSAASSRNDTSTVRGAVLTCGFVVCLAVLIVGTGAAMGAGGSAPTGLDEVDAAQTTDDCHQELPDSGTVNYAVILAKFADHSEEHTPERSEMAARIFGDEPSAASGPGSVADYYEAVSDGRLTLSKGPAGLSGWHEINLTSSEVGDDDRRAVARRAVQAALDSGYDFSAYDNSGNGCVSVAVVTSGTASYRPQFTAFAEPISTRGVQVTAYTLQGAGTAREPAGIGVFAHETGHQIGPADYYAENAQAGSGIDGWGLMGLGYHGDLPGGQESDSPVYPMAYIRNRLGWATTTRLPAGDQPGILPAAATVPVNYRVDTANTDEYYLLEARRHEGFDRGLDSLGNQPGLVASHRYPDEVGDESVAVSHYPGDGGTFSDETDEYAPVSDGRDSGVSIRNVRADHGTYQFNDPAERRLSAGGRAVYAVPVGQRLSGALEARRAIDSRVSWADAGEEMSVELHGPDGTSHTSEATGTTFEYARGRAPPTDGGWKLVETTDSGTVEYYTTTTYPRYELPTDAAAVETGTDASTGDLTVTVAVAAGGEPYTPAPSGPVTASQFDLSVRGQEVSGDSVRIVERDGGAYTLAADGVSANEVAPDDISVAFTDEKFGVRHTTSGDDAAVGTAGRVALAADVWANQTVVSTDETAVFAAHRLSSPTGTIRSFEWDFGDGTTASGPVAEHRFAATGTYSVELTVTDENGATATETVEVTVKPPRAPNRPPQAAIDGVPTTVEVGEQIVASALESVDPDGSIRSYEWNFGDGTSRANDYENAVTTYDEPGQYLLELTVTDDRGGTDTTTATVEVSEPTPLATSTETSAPVAVVNDYDGTPGWPGSNDAGGYSGGGFLADSSVANGSLTIEYAESGWFTTTVAEDVSAADALVFRMRGTDGGEESEILVTFGDTRRMLGALTDDTVTSGYTTVRVPLSRIDVDEQSPGDITLNFWQGGSGTVEIDEIYFE